MEVEEGESLDDAIAEVVENLLKSGVDTSKLEAILAKYKAPKNCQMLMPVRVNQGIWSVLSTAARTEDAKLQKQQTTIVKALTATSSAANDVHALMENGTPLANTLEKLADAIAMLAAINRDINMKRRTLIKPELNENYRHLCAPTVPITSQLFGDDVQERIKQQGETNKAFQQIAATRGRGRGFGTRTSPFPHSNQRQGQGRGCATAGGDQGSQRGRPGFLRGRGQFPRGQGDFQPRGR